MELNLKGFRSHDISGKWVVTIGNFDGYHAGHQALVRQVLADSDRLGVQGGVLTFAPHPKILLQPNIPFRNIYDDQSKWNYLKTAGLDACILISFTREFAALSPLEFINQLFDSIEIVKIIVGYDFNFGRAREGSAALIKAEACKRGVEFKRLDPVKIKGITVSSTMIRRLIFEGEFEVVKSFLGRAWGVSGTVIEGQKLGRKLGFPTLNIEPNILLPVKEGVYAVEVKQGETTFHGVSNLGYRPTLKGQRFGVETHVFGLEREIYGEEVSIFPLKFIREEAKFSSLGELQIQIKKDVTTVKNWFSKQALTRI
jgi:riboflavin kinase/FMN adenylyltransferase